MLLLDEFQTWYDGLTNTKQYPWKNWAFNFIQILSEIAKEHPDLLVLVISVRNGGSDAYQQVHRVNPVAIDFKAGGNPERVQQDRRRMLLHRLFDNRLQIAKASIAALVAPHVDRVLPPDGGAAAEHERKRKEFLDSWPFAPHLLRLLEEQVLIATDAQETRDMIRILANLYKSRGEVAPVLTAADFRLDDDASGIGALLDSVSNQHHRTLRAKAQQNIISVTDAVPDHASLAPHLQEIVGALWLRSIAVGNLAGAEPATLQVDITRRQGHRRQRLPGRAGDHRREQLQHPPGRPSAGLPRGREPAGQADGLRAQRQAVHRRLRPRAARQGGPLRHRRHRRGGQDLPRDRAAEILADRPLDDAR